MRHSILFATAPFPNSAKFSRNLIAVIPVTANLQVALQNDAFSGGKNDADEDSCGGSHLAVCGLSRSRPPGLEQKHDNGSSRRSWIHDCLRGGSCVGTEGVWAMALKSTVRSHEKATSVSKNAFAGQSVEPSRKELAAVLGPNLALWTKLVSDLRHELKLDGEDWHSSGMKYGWSYRLQLRTRNIVYLGPRVGFFVAAFALGDKAVAAARQSGLPARVLKMLAEARRYAEGTALGIEVASPEDLDIVKTLVRIKVDN